jgi:hypothetical protein
MSEGVEVDRKKISCPQSFKSGRGKSEKGLTIACFDRKGVGVQSPEALSDDETRHRNGQIPKKVNGCFF